MMLRGHRPNYMWTTNKVNNNSLIHHFCAGIGHYTARSSDVHGQLLP